MKMLSTTVSEISAATGIGNILEVTELSFGDTVLVLQMDNEPMLNIRQLNRVAQYFGVSQEDIFLNCDDEGRRLLIEIIGARTTSDSEEVDSDDSWEASQALHDFRRKNPNVKPLSEQIRSTVQKLESLASKPQCCGTGGCMNCPSITKTA